MFARLTTTLIGPEEPDAAAEIVERILPTLEALDGFLGVIVLVDEKTRLVHGMTLWNSAEEMERSEPVIRGIREAETRTRDIVSQESATFRVAAFHIVRQ
jgi:hypothetical protein